MHRSPDKGTLDILVRTDDLVSLHRTRLSTTPLGKTAARRTFVIDPTPLVVEPTRQEHARAPGRTRGFWQAPVGGRLHEAVTTAPEPARSNAEVVDRVVEHRLEDIRRAIWQASRSYREYEGYVWLTLNRISGEGLHTVDFLRGGIIDILSQYPNIQRALHRHRPYRDWHPVVVDGVRYAGLRWLPMRAGVDESTRPPSEDEVSVRGHLWVVEG